MEVLNPLGSVAGPGNDEARMQLWVSVWQHCDETEIMSRVNASPRSVRDLLDRAEYERYITREETVSFTDDGAIKFRRIIARLVEMLAEHYSNEYVIHGEDNFMDFALERFDDLGITVAIVPHPDPIDIDGSPRMVAQMLDSLAPNTSFADGSLATIYGIDDEDLSDAIDLVKGYNAIHIPLFDEQTDDTVPELTIGQRRTLEEHGFLEEIGSDHPEYCGYVTYEVDVSPETARELTH